MGGDAIEARRRVPRASPDFKAGRHQGWKNLGFLEFFYSFLGFLGF